jgi:hypothetical protein
LAGSHGRACLDTLHGQNAEYVLRRTVPEGLEQRLLQEGEVRAEPGRGKQISQLTAWGSETKFRWEATSRSTSIASGAPLAPEVVRGLVVHLRSAL